MFSRIKTTLAALSVGIAAAAFATAPAQAATVYESATHTDNSSGGYSIYDQRYFGVGFTLDTATNITGIGGEFDNIAGNIFGAIVALPSGGGLPSFAPTELAAHTLASVNFTGPSGVMNEVVAPLSLTLGAGDYALIFGGLGATTNTGGMTADNDTVGSPNLFQYFNLVYGDAWTTNSIYDGLRFTVEGTPVAGVPEPAEWAMLMTGFGLLGYAMRRRRSVTLSRA